MWIVSKKFTFEAAHKLPYHDGKCARLHGHSWVLSVFIEGDSLISEGCKTNMIIDYGDIKKIVTPLIDEFLDHHYLNDSLQMESPTSESIAKWIYDRLLPKMDGLIGVLINETCTSSCFYTDKSGFNLSSINSVLGG